jgi:hypothetical protein
VLHGDWGFTSFDGPSFHLQTPQPGVWRIDDDDRQNLVVGRDDTLHLDGEASACVKAVSLQQGSGNPEPTVWKIESPERLSVTAPLAAASPGDVSLLVDHYGQSAPQRIAARAYTQAGHIDGLTVYAGDPTAALKGSRLDEVTGMTLAGLELKPRSLSSAGGADELSLQPVDTDALSKLKPGQSVSAKVALKDGRTMTVKAKVGPQRPKVALVDKNIAVPPPPSPSHIAIQLGGSDQLPQNGRLTFSVRAPDGVKLSSKDTVEVATADGSASTVLSAGAGLMLADAQVAVASLDAAKAFNTSTFGPLQFRLVHDGVAGDWQPLADLVRLPLLHDLRCQGGPGQPCQLTGDNLFLIASLSADPDFGQAMQAPEGFAGQVLPVPRPHGGKLYLKLRDNPAVIDVASVSPGR